MTPRCEPVPRILSLLYPVGPVGCAPHVSNATKSSTCNEGGLEVFGGLDLKGSTPLPAPLPTGFPLIEFANCVLPLICDTVKTKVSLLNSTNFYFFFSYTVIKILFQLIEKLIFLFSKIIKKIL